MTIGFDQPLYILPFDQRESLQTKMFGWKGALSTAQTAEISAAKAVIYDGFQTALAEGAPQEPAAVLVDEQFGAAILRDASRRGYMTACPVEKSGQDDFDFEYGEDFAYHIEKFNPTFGKVLVRYNPAGDKPRNRRQAARLKRLSDCLHGSDRHFMVELYVDAEPEQLKRFDGKTDGQTRAYDLELRPELTVQTLHELQDAGVEPDVWKVTGMDHREGCVNVVAAARRDNRDHVGCIVLGGGEDEQQVREWLATAASVAGFIGFAVGRTTFWDALVDWRANRTTREAAVAEIARRYREWVDIFETGSLVPVESANLTAQALRRWENEGGHR
jgi:myo-inositol catabolism protein IolC